MSELLMTIGEGLTVLVDYDHYENEDTVIVITVTINDTDIKGILNHKTIETIEQNVFDSFDKELQEPDYEYIEG